MQVYDACVLRSLEKAELAYVSGDLQKVPLDPRNQTLDPRP